MIRLTEEYLKFPLRGGGLRQVHKLSQNTSGAFDPTVRSPSISRGDEHIVKSTLKLVVFHLQRLSETSFREVDLVSDERYLRLKSDIFSLDKMKGLSPAQILAAAVSLGRLRGRNLKEWSSICNAVKNISESDQYRLSASQIGVCLYSIARSGNCACAKDRFLVSVLKRFLKQSGEWNAIDMGWVLHFLRKKKQPRELPVVSRTIRQLAFRFNERAAGMTPKQISCILSEFGHLKSLPGLAIKRALTAIDSRKNKMDAKTITLLLRALANMRVYRNDFLHSISRNITRAICDAKKSDMKQVSSILYSLSKLDWFNEPIVRTACKRVEDGGAISDADLAMIAYGLGRLGIRSCTDTWKVLAFEFAKRLDTMSPLNVSVIVGALGKVGYRDDDLMKSVALRVKADVKGYTSRQIVTALNGMANCGVNVSDMIPKNLDITKETQFQLNKINYAKDPENVIMEPRKISFLHNKAKDLLLANKIQRVELSKRVGPVYVDALFELDGRPTALIFLADSDVCKFNKDLLLGPSSWMVRALQDQEVQVIVVHKEIFIRADSLSVIQGLERLDVACQWFKPKPRIPFVYDFQSGKVSFTNSFIGHT